MNKEKIKFLKSLNRKKNRKENNKILIEGYRLIKEAILYNADIENLWMTQKFEEENLEIITLINNKIEYELITNRELSRICDSKHPQEIAAEINIEYLNWKMQNTFDNILILDGISDPGNLGTILRSAEWFGIKSVIISDDSVDIYNPKTMRSGMGAHFMIKNLFQTDLFSTIADLKDTEYTIIGAAMDGLSYNELNLNSKQRWALILGSEAKGISDKTLQFIDKFVSIPKIGNIESLNVAMAGTILLDRLTSK